MTAAFDRAGCDAQDLRLLGSNGFSRSGPCQRSDDSAVCRLYRMQGWLL